MSTLFSSMSFTNHQWNDIVFENRNKDYGAYYIRTHYNENVGKAFGIVSLFLLTFIVSVILYLNVSSGSTAMAKPSHKDTLFVAKPVVIMVSQPSGGAVSPKTTNNQRVPTIHIDSTIDQPVDTMPIISTGKSNNPLALNTPTNSGGGNGEPHEIISPLTIDTAVKIVVDNMPEFPGGEAALEKYILKHTIIPNQWSEEGPGVGKVYFRFVVGMNGVVRDVKILSDNAGFGCAESNTGMILNMPAWKPGRQNGHAVNVQMQLPIIFRKD